MSHQPLTSRELIGAAALVCWRSDAESRALIAVHGQLDLAAAPHIDRVIADAQQDAAIVVLDLRELQFVDSGGVRVILAADRRARRAGGRLVVVRGPELSWFLRVLGIDCELELMDEPPEGGPLPRGWQGCL